MLTGPLPSLLPASANRLSKADRPHGMTTRSGAVHPSNTIITAATRTSCTPCSPPVFDHHNHKDCTGHQLHSCPTHSTPCRYETPLHAPFQQATAAADTCMHKCRQLHMSCRITITACNYRMVVLVPAGCRSAQHSSWPVLLGLVSLPGCLPACPLAFLAALCCTTAQCITFLQTVRHHLVLLVLNSLPQNDVLPLPGLSPAATAVAAGSNEAWHDRFRWHDSLPSR